MSRFAYLTLALALSCSLSAHAATTTTPAQTTQQNKMKACAAQYHSKGIQKSQYHAFMSQCLKKNDDATGITSKTLAPVSNK